MGGQKHHGNPLWLCATVALKGVLLDDLSYLSFRAYEDFHTHAKRGGKALFKLPAQEERVRLMTAKDNVPTADIGYDMPQAERLMHGFEIIHAYVATSHVDPAK